jgi:hypothetical protein
VWLGEPEVAIEHAARAMRLSPHDPLTFFMQATTAAGHFFAGRNAEALAWAERSIREHSGHLHSTTVAAAAGAIAGNQAAAGKAVLQLRQIDPNLRVSNLGETYPMRRPQDFDRLAEGLRKAGLPE